MSAGLRPSERLFAVCLWLLGCSLAATDAAAVLIASGDGTGNTTAPADDFGFANVGIAGQSVVYLGRGWVITANHVPLGPVTLDGRVFPAVPGSHTRLRNRGPGVSADVAVFRLQDPPPALPELAIRSTPPEIGSEVVLAGNGPDRGAPLEIDGEHGFAWLDTTRVRWGTNRVLETDVPVQIGVGDITRAFSMRFDPAGDTEHEAQVGTGDSGGAAFIQSDGAWELAGVIFAANRFAAQPERSSFYGNFSYAVDLSAYREQILALTSRPACSDELDDDGDGLVDHPADPDCASPEGASEAPPGAVAGRAPDPPPAPGFECGNGWPFVLVIPLFWWGGRWRSRRSARAQRGPQAGPHA